jgi:recombination protein RecT
MSNENAVAVVCQTIKSAELQQQIHQALPPSVSLDRFTRTTLTAIQQNPSVLEADRKSLYSAIVRAAQDGLQPDGRESALVVFNTKVGDKWEKRVQYLPMIFGLTKKLAKAGIRLKTAAVYSNDDFDYEQGDEEQIHHKPAKLGTPRGEVIGAYAIAKLPDGSMQREVMDKEEIDRARAVSKGKDGPAWTNWYSMQARKTVGKRLANRIGIDDEEVSEFIRRTNEDEVEAVVPEAPAPQQAAITEQPKRPSGLQAALDQVPPAEDVDVI